MISRILRSTVVFSAFSTALLATENTRVAVKVDPRLELVGVVCRLAGFEEYRHSVGESTYTHDADSWFHEFEDHPAVVRMKDLRRERGISYDATASFAIHLEDETATRFAMPLTPWPKAFEKRWNAESAEAFRADLQDFATASRFRSFFDRHAELYAATEKRLAAIVEGNLDLAWFEEYYGTVGDATFGIHPGLFQGGHNYGVSIEYPDGKRAITPAIGCWKFDQAGIPEFDATMIPLLVHEFSHAHCNPVIDRHWEDLAKAGDVLFPRVAAQMQRQAYGEWKIVLYESLVRASVLRYLLKHDDKKMANALAADDTKRGFLWIADLAKRLGEYEADRKQYPTLDAFAPRLVAFFDEQAQKQGEVDAKAPKIVKITPADGATDVPAGAFEIVVEFDRAMDTTGHSVTIADVEFPPIDKSRTIGFDKAGKKFTLPVTLEPGKTYGFGLNGPNFQGFKSKDGIVLPAVVVKFTTAR